MFLRFPNLVPLLLVSAACAVPEPTDLSVDEAEPQSVVFRMKTKERTYENCVAGSAECSYIRFDYPVVVEAPEGRAVETVTELVRTFLAEPIWEPGEGEAPTGIEATMERFIEEYRGYRSRDRGEGASWFLERKTLVLWSGPNILSLSFSQKSYLGGDERSDWIRFTNLDPRTGASIALAQLVREDAVEELRTVAEARFRSQAGIEPGVSFEEAGFTFPGGIFPLAKDYSLGERGLTFYYSEELGPEAPGSISVFLKLADIDALLRPEYRRDAIT